MGFNSVATIANLRCWLQPRQTHPWARIIHPAMVSSVRIWEIWTSSTNIIAVREASFRRRKCVKEAIGTRKFVIFIRSIAYLLKIDRRGPWWNQMCKGDRDQMPPKIGRQRRVLRTNGYLRATASILHRWVSKTITLCNEVKIFLKLPFPWIAWSSNLSLNTAWVTNRK